MQIAVLNKNIYLKQPLQIQESFGNDKCGGMNFVQNSAFTTENVKANYLVNFTSLKAESEGGLPIDSAFYRDLYTLLNFSKLMLETFPDGADIMDFACSNGEEAISLHSLINDKNKVNYKLYCYDTSDQAIKRAKNNVYSVCAKAGDEFLINEKSSNEIYNEAARCFYELMEEIPKPSYEINDEEFMSRMRKQKGSKEKYFKIRNEYVNNFKFEKGDIRNILNIEPDKQVGAVFFRNAFYHLTYNHTYDRIYDREILKKIKNTNKDEVIQEVVDKVYDKLLPGGFFVLGNDVKEHLYQADRFTPKEEIYFDDESEEYLRLKSPLEQALRKDKRFKPVVISKCYTDDSCSFTVPTVWQKTEN